MGLKRRELAGLAGLLGLIMGMTGCGGGGSAPGAGDHGTLTSSSGGTTSTPSTLPTANVVAFPAPTHANNPGNITFQPASHLERVAAGVTPANQFYDSATNGLNALALQTAYGEIQEFSSTDLSNTSNTGGTGVVVAIVDAVGYNSDITTGYGDSKILADLQTYSTACGLPDPTSQLTIAEEAGTLAGGGWSVETALDVDMVHAMAPQAQILLVLAKSPNLADMLAAVDYASNASVNGVPVSVVSMSWSTGASEGGTFTTGGLTLNITFFDFHMQHDGVSYFGATGDTGGKVGWPATCPSVVAVGGTVLDMTSGSAVETAWNGGGGGASVYESAPSYQAFTTKSMREIPDVAAVSAGVMLVRNGAKGTVAGTSVATPIWASLGAEAGELKHSPLSQMNTDLYHWAVGQTGGQPDFSQAPPGLSYTANYRDITGGSNGFAATTGYDLATGLGAPLGNSLLPNLATGQ